MVRISINIMSQWSSVLYYTQCTRSLNTATSHQEIMGVGDSNTECPELTEQVEQMGKKKMLTGWLCIHGAKIGEVSMVTERDQNMTQSRRKEVIESNAGENNTPQKPQRLNLGYDSKVTKTEEASIQVEETFLCTCRMTYLMHARWPHLGHLNLRECPVGRS